MSSQPIGDTASPPLSSRPIQHTMPFLLSPFRELIKARVMREDTGDDKERRIPTVEVLKEKQLRPEMKLHTP